MNDLSNKNLNEDDRLQAIESLRLLIKGIPIRDDEGSLIGFIEKPDMNAIKYVLGSQKSISDESNIKHNNINKFTGVRNGKK